MSNYITVELLKSLIDENQQDSFGVMHILAPMGSGKIK